MNIYIPPAPVRPDNARWKPVFRGFPEDFDVLTDRGWVNFSVLVGVPGSGVVPAGVGVSDPFVPSDRQAPTFPMNEFLWERYKVTDEFPRVATVDPQSGAMFFVRPGRVVRGRFEHDRLIRLKAKGVDLFVTPFTDLWVKRKYARSWGFMLADDIVRNRHSSSNYLFVNKFKVGVDPVTGVVGPGARSHLGVNPNAPATGIHYKGDRAHSGNSTLVDMYGWFDVSPYLGELVRLPGVGGSEVVGVSSSLSGLLSAPITLYPRKHASRERIYNHYWVENIDPMTGRLVKADVLRDEVSVFNLVMPPYHNLVVRKSKMTDNPRVEWVGGPLVVGDAYDKAELLVAGVTGLGSGGGSYSPFRPDWRSRTPEGLRKEDN